MSALLENLGVVRGHLWWPCFVAIVVLGLVFRAAAFCVLLNQDRHLQAKSPVSLCRSRTSRILY